MLSETVFRSADLPAEERFDAWRECLGRTHVPLELTSRHRADFLAFQRLIPLGEVRLWPATFQQVEFRRTPRLIRESDPEVFHLSLVLRGEAGVSWGRRQAAYRPFDFHASDSARPYDIWTGERISTVGIEIPKTALALPLGRAELAIGQRMSGRDGVGALLAQFLVRLTADTGCYDAGDAPRLGTVVTDLVTVLFAHRTDGAAFLPPETRTRTLTLRVKAFIRRNLQDPGLTPRLIADAHHISCSYLHRLFQSEADTVAGYIRRQRLEGARRDLGDPALRDTPIYVIAARWGFPRAADFTRAFRGAYQVSPRDHRHHAAGTPALP
jgi:AraC-like DNA-binding protein